MKICIVVPMYNEEVITRGSIETILHFTRTLPPVVTIVVVNDGSKDNTESIIWNTIEGLDEKDFVLITHPANRGYGAALRTVIQYAIERQYDYVLFMDSDLTNDPEDVIKASRYIHSCAVEGVPLYKVFMSHARKPQAFKPGNEWHPFGAKRRHFPAYLAWLKVIAGMPADLKPSA